QIGDYTATIHWGDGQSSAGAVSYDSGQQRFVVSGSHTYANVGNFPLTVNITDQGGASASTLGTWTIPASAAMPWTAVGQAVTALGGKIYVYSGWNGSGPDNQFAAYDPSAGTWTELPTPSPDMARYLSAMAAAGGNLYLFGGRDPSGNLTDTIQEYVV